MDLGQTISGNFGIVAKAQIEIEDRRGDAVTEEEAVSIQKKNPGISVENFGAADSGMKYVSQKSVKTYVVQFNPSTLSLQARGPGYMNVMAFDESGKTAGPSMQRVRVYFSVQLIIDQEDNFDCFLEDKMNLSPTQLAQNAIKGGMKLAGKGKEPTVKDVVEGFIAAIRSPRTREVGFRWGKMYYHGELNQVRAQYVMFNRKGQPVRATIEIGIQCFNEDALPNKLGEWEAAYKKAFGAGDLRSAGVGQKLGNILNLG